jgi:hypothetical protein
MRLVSLYRRARRGAMKPSVLIVLALLSASVSTRPLIANSAALSSRQSQLLAKIQTSIGTQGAQATLRQYFDCEKQPYQGYDLIQTGHPSAIELAVTLLRSADGCVSELLHSSIAIALPRQPEVVLQYFADYRLQASAQNCIPMMIEVPKAQVEATLRRTEVVLANVTTPSLQDAKAACLRQIGEYRNAVNAPAAR